MKNWKQAKQAYITDHMKKPLAAHSIRLNALKKIESVMQAHAQDLLVETFFRGIAKNDFLKLYEKWKGIPLNGAEKSVINGLYKFSEE